MGAGRPVETWSPCERIDRVPTMDGYLYTSSMFGPSVGERACGPSTCSRGNAPGNVRPRGGGGGRGIRQTILTRGVGIRHEMNAQGSGNSTYFILLPA